MQYSCLSIDREEFLRIYKGLPIIGSVDLFYSKPESQEVLLHTYFPSKLWRLNNMYAIVDKYAKRIRFTMNRAQHKVYAKSLRHPRIIVLKSRQQGISTLWLVSFFDDAVCNKDFSIGLMAQGQHEASTLLERTKILWDELSPVIKEYLSIGITRDNTKEISFSNGSNIFIRTSFRSATLQRLHISEMGKIANLSPEKAQETKTGTLQAIAQGNTAVIESTAEGDNLFKDMWDNAVTYIQALSPKDFYPVFLSWLDDPDCTVDVDQVITLKNEKYFAELEKQLCMVLSREQKNFWIVQYRELGDKIYQEYPSTAAEAFMATKVGAYWAKLYYLHVTEAKREQSNLYDPNLSVQVSVDLGMDDTNVLNVFQYYKGYRIISELADNGEEIKFYCDWMKEQPWFCNMVHLILPHDGEVRELTSGKTRTQVFEEELRLDNDGKPTGIYVTILPRTSSINEDIDQVRGAIKDMWLDTKIEYLKYCLLNFTKDWDDKLSKWKNKPRHDEASNGAATMRYMVQGVNKGSTFINKGRSKSQVLRTLSRGSTDV